MICSNIGLAGSFLMNIELQLVSKGAKLGFVFGFVYLTQAEAAVLCGQGVIMGVVLLTQEVGQRIDYFLSNPQMILVI